MQVGTEWIIDAEGCDPEALRDNARLASLFEEILRDLNLHPIGTARWHVFPHPGGITGMVMLAESHLACHTYPEFRSATFNLYCCRERPEWRWRERLAETLGASRVRVRKIARGRSGGPDTPVGASDALTRRQECPRHHVSKDNR